MCNCIWITILGLLVSITTLVLVIILLVNMIKVSKQVNNQISSISGQIGSQVSSIKSDVDTAVSAVKSGSALSSLFKG